MKTFYIFDFLQFRRFNTDVDAEYDDQGDYDELVEEANHRTGNKHCKKHWKRFKFTEKCVNKLFSNYF